MQRAKTLTRLLKQLAELVAEEAEHNAAFAAKLDAVLAPIPAERPKNPKPSPKAVPDVYAELLARGDEEFRFWLAGLELGMLKAVVKANGFDPARHSSRWTEPDKFVALIAEQAKARLKRGSAFITPREGDAGQNRPD